MNKCMVAFCIKSVIAAAVVAAFAGCIGPDTGSGVAAFDAESAPLRVAVRHG